MFCVLDIERFSRKAEFFKVHPNVLSDIEISPLKIVKLPNLHGVLEEPRKISWRPTCDKRLQIAHVITYRSFGFRSFRNISHRFLLETPEGRD